MEISASDYLTRKDHLLERISLLDKDQDRTKAKLVQELIDVTLPVLEQGLIPGWTRDKTANYLWQEFDKHNVDYTYQNFIQQFPDDLKRKYSKSNVTLHLKHDFVKLTTLTDGTLVRKCECGKYEIAGMVADLQEPEVEEDTREDEHIKSTSKVQGKLPKSIILEANKTTLAFLDTMKVFVKEFDVKCRNPKILKDLENDMEYKDIARMCLTLQSLFEPPMEKMFHEGAVPSIMNQMLDETNFRAPVTMLQKALCYSLQSLTTYRQWAHKLSISPRQHQRVRERLAEWVAKKAEKIIDNVLGSHECPACMFNLVSLKAKPGITVKMDPAKMGKKKPKILYGERWYEIPKKYQGKD